MPDLTPDQAIQTLRGLPEARQRAILSKLSPDVKRGIMGRLSATAPSTPTAPPPSAPTSEPRTFGKYADEIVRGVGRGLKNDVTGLYGAIRHPINTATAMEEQTETAGRQAAKEFKETEGAPLPERLTAAGLSGLENAPLVGGMVQRAEQGGIASPESAGAAAEAITTLAAPEAAIKFSGPMTRALKTGAERARGTRAAVEAVKSASEKAATQAADRVKEVRDFQKKRSEVREKNTELQKEKSRKEALQTGVERLDTEIRTDLEKTEKDVNIEANRRYNELAKTLNPIQADQKTLNTSLDAALQKIKGTEVEPTILKSISKRLETEALTYEDLQGYRAEIGRELAKGSLPGDIFSAYKSLQSSITDEMQRIADSKGVGSQFRDARDYYRRYADAFLERTSPIRRALNSKERGGVTSAFKGKDASGVEALAQFNPDLALRINTSRGYQAEGKAPASKAQPKAEPTLPSPPELIKITESDISKSKAEGVKKSAQHLSDYGLRRALYVAGYTAPAALLTFLAGHPGAATAVELASAPTIFAASHMIANVLESPGVTEWLSKVTPRDLEAIQKLPPEQRAAFDSKMQPLVQAAQKRGVNVDPLLITALAGVGMPKSRQLKETRANQLAAQQ